MDNHIEFVDLSRHQGFVDFNVLKSTGVPLVFMRATVGNTYKDDRFEEYWREAGRVGLKRGIYMVVVPGQTGQITNLRLALGNKVPDFPIAIDLEIWWRRMVKVGGNWIRYPHKRETINQTFLQVYQELQDFMIDAYANEWRPRSIEPIVYTNADMSYRMGSPSFLEDVSKWVANYTGADKPIMPIPWDGKDWDMWQWSADHPPNYRGPEFGVQGSKSVDLNRMRLEFWDKYIVDKKGDPPPKPPANGPLTTEERLNDHEVRIAKLENS